MTLPIGSRSPALFQTLSLVADPIAFFDRNSAKYGDTFTARVLGPASPPVVFLGRPEAIQAVFTTLADAFEFGKVTNVFRPLVGNESLIMNEGPTSATATAINARAASGTVAQSRAFDC